ncbi:putative RNA polymerase sigma E protein [Thermus thermophilus]|uniref:sigma-70 family RNA polymerase sigma factor n=1 Tax=Thermus thermophilus TaxID=274 RepID=UPI00194DC44D|nr:sigma-70 family RNA polymerase sigma factor [Thermus thermophilus]BCP98085.1 putative RNA polymerase sigma E protein [Thermus thermophilus]BCQ00416.1 putative RNA polymerase sigma E protein [Thermus thermophilus]
MGLPADSLSDEALLALVARGDEEAFRALFRRYAGSFLALARRMGLDGAAAEDVVQEAMIRVWQKAKEFDPRRGSARAFLLTLGHHAAVDEVRRRAARPLSLEPDPEREEEAFDLPGPGLDEEGHLDRTRLGRALKALSPEERRVIEVLYYQGYTHREAASLLGLPLGTLKTWARRALSKLKEVLREP